MNRDSIWTTLSRREFVRLASLAAGMFAVPACTDDDAEGPAEDVGSEPSLDVVGDPDAAADAFDTGEIGPELPSLGGAPDTPEGRAIAAFVDVIIPGRHRDPTGAPGALDVGAAALFFDPDLPALPLVPVLVLALDGIARNRYDGRVFVELDPDQRDDVVARSLEASELMGFAIQLGRLAYYSSRGAADHLGYPGANPGYVDHPDFGFGRAMATEITSDGNLD